MRTPGECAVELFIVVVHVEFVNAEAGGIRANVGATLKLAFEQFAIGVVCCEVLADIPHSIGRIVALIEGAVVTLVSPCLVDFILNNTVDLPLQVYLGMVNLAMSYEEADKRKLFGALETAED